MIKIKNTKINNFSFFLKVKKKQNKNPKRAIKVALEKAKKKTIDWGTRKNKNTFHFLVSIKARIVKEIVINNQKARQLGF
jgi:hypothetical protein